MYCFLHLVAAFPIHCIGDLASKLFKNWSEICTPPHVPTSECEEELKTNLLSTEKQKKNIDVNNASLTWKGPMFSNLLIMSYLAFWKYLGVPFTFSKTVHGSPTS